MEDSVGGGGATDFDLFKKWWPRLQSRIFFSTNVETGLQQATYACIAQKKINLIM